MGFILSRLCHTISRTSAQFVHTCGSSSQSHLQLSTQSPAPSRMYQRVAIGMATEVVQPPGSRTHQVTADSAHERGPGCSISALPQGSRRHSRPDSRRHLPRAGWIRMLQLKQLRKQSKHPVQGLTAVPGQARHGRCEIRRGGWVRLVRDRVSVRTTRRTQHELLLIETQYRRNVRGPLTGSSRSSSATTTTTTTTTSIRQGSSTASTLILPASCRLSSVPRGLSR